jgi:hypothetical protein
MDETGMVLKVPSGNELKPAKVVNQIIKKIEALEKNGRFRRRFI